ncbi:MAG: ATP-binding cassette domain-containing protein, partial [Ilumatobacteraceae bacterium]
MQGVVKRFGDTLALDGVDLAVPAGAVYGLLGPNGAGKTTSVKVLTTLIRPDAGTATIDGIDVVKNPDDVRRRIGLTGQYAAVDERLTARENLVYIGRLFHLGTAEARVRAGELLDRFDLADSADRVVKGFSGGMRRRLDIAMSEALPLEEAEGEDNVRDATPHGTLAKTFVRVTRVESVP